MAQNSSVAFGARHDSLSVRSFSVTERLSGLFDVSVVALSSLDDLDFETIVGQPASFRLERPDGGAGPAREWSGVCNHFEQREAESTGLSTYLVRVVPDLWLLTQRQNSRIFQHLTTPEIAGKLLAEWQIELALELDAGAHARHEYRVQYAETDFAFLSRLLEDAGLSYRIEQDDGAPAAGGGASPKAGSPAASSGSCPRMRVVLSDAPQQRKERAAPAIAYADQPPRNTQREFVTRVRVARELRPGKVTLRDFDFRGRIDYPLFGKAAPTPGLEGGLEQYRYAPGAFVTEGRPGAPHVSFADEKEGAALAERGLSAERATAELITFETNVPDLAPGTVFSVSGHPRSELSKKLLGVELRFNGAANGEWTVSGTAVSAGPAYRPARLTPRPVVSGVQSALVVGPRGEEIHTDELGRVRVQFPWDREGKFDEHSSCWVRVGQGWAGAGFGMMVLPRVGQEVTVGFFEGNPDQPVVLGRVYNSVNQVPYKLPENKTRSGWRTSSSPASAGAPAFNELLFEDKKGAELLGIRAQRDLTKLVKGSEVERTGTDRTIAVGKNRSATIGAVDSTLVGGRHLVEIAAKGGQPPTRLEMSDKHIVFTTGEATVTFDGPNLALEAKGNITIVAHEGDVVIRGGPNVKINCA